MKRSLTIKDPWKKANLSADLKQSLINDWLPEYMLTCRWFGAKNAPIKRYEVSYAEMRSFDDSYAMLLFVEIVFQTAYSETYFLPLTFVSKETAVDEHLIIAELTCDKEPGLLVEALGVESYRNDLFDNICHNRNLKIGQGSLKFSKGKSLKSEPVTSVLLTLEQSNTTVVFNDKYFLKIYRKLFRGTNPDFEVSQHLSENSNFENSPPYMGSITLEREGMYTVSIGLMLEKVENNGEAWGFMLDRVEHYFKNIERRKLDIEQIPKVALYEGCKPENLPLTMLDLVGIETLERVSLLAKRTAEMHLALFSEKINHEFIPASFNADYQVWLHNRLLYQLDNRVAIIENMLDKFSGKTKEWATEFLNNTEMIKNRILSFDYQKLNSHRIRIHGDYHLGQVLMTDDDFYILDFEGEPDSTIRDRKIKQPAIKDVAGMFRSFHYAIFSTIFADQPITTLPTDFMIEAGGRYYRTIVAVFLDAYISTAFESGLDIGYYKEIDYLLRYHILEKAIYELGYELNSRPEWAIIPLKGINQILNND
jgi:trehalose synthase-fused probable maltokinase